jgi:Tfp pilus assembly protein PilZ
MALTKAEEKRRAGGAIRVPFVRRCDVSLPGRAPTSAFIVNINVLGAYVALDAMPPLGEAVSFSFQFPGSERRAVIDGVVAWTNPRQEHPVHSLPPGFGLAFRKLDDDARRHIEDIVFEYLKRQSSDD